ncbi:hypothetical protein [Streptomyces sp. Inha503]|uniref:hypothetical protein n=1 Tax=Streptomyces sp. Inha503 TaxID=3383314 RepID=UPI0039A1B890
MSDRSHALRGVGDTTRHRVEDATGSLGFRPNRAARGLAGKAARSLTILTSDTSLYGAAPTLRGMEEAARTASFTVAVSVLDRHAGAQVAGNAPSGFAGLGRICFGLLHRLLDLAAPAPDPCDEPILIVRESTGPHRGTSG